jgi:glycosyltransferase involved in cell wall biosynthesis
MKYNNMELPSQVSGIFDSDTDQRPVMVTIRCITYNHEPYIRQALDGFVMQKTKFRFEAIVHDDVSTDSTASIIREYAERFPDIIKPIFETENQYSKADGSLTRILDAATRGKYIAFCEGDDYWTDPFKLQKQVEFLESHSDYGISYGLANIYTQRYNKFKGIAGRAYSDYESFLAKTCIPTLTALCRTSIYLEYMNVIHPSNKGWLMGDYPLWLYITYKTKVHFLDEILGVYRNLDESATKPNSVQKVIAFNKSNSEISYFFIKFWNLSCSTQCIEAINSREIRSNANTLFFLGHYRESYKWFKYFQHRTYKDWLRMQIARYSFLQSCFKYLSRLI